MLERTGAIARLRNFGEQHLDRKLTICLWSEGLVDTSGELAS